MSNTLRMALTKGRLEKDTTALLEKAGFDISALTNKGRRLILPVGDGLEIVLAKSADVITYVEHGVCDIGIVGRDTIMEMGGAYYEMLTLPFGKCRFAVAGKPENKDFSGYTMRIATKYPNVTRAYFGKKHMDVEIIKIEGSVELAPLLNLSDAIVDIVETGSTLKANGLTIYEYICDISARVIVGTAAAKLKKDRVDTLLRQLMSYAKYFGEEN